MLLNYVEQLLRKRLFDLSRVGKARVFGIYGKLDHLFDTRLFRVFANIGFSENMQIEALHELREQAARLGMEVK